MEQSESEHKDINCPACEAVICYGKQREEVPRLCAAWRGEARRGAALDLIASKRNKMRRISYLRTDADAV